MSSVVVHSELNDSTLKYFFYMNESTVIDISSNNKSIVNNGCTFVNSSDGFNCTTYLTFFNLTDTNVFKGNNNWTLSMWRKTNQRGTSSNPLGVYSQAINGGGSNTAIFFIEGYSGNGNIDAYHSSTGSSWTNHKDAASGLAAGGWYHLIFVREGNVITTYVNNVTQSMSGSDAGSIYDSSRNEYIGGIDGATAATQPQAVFKSVALWNRSLTAAERSQLYASGDRTYNFINNTVPPTPSTYTIKGTVKYNGTALPNANVSIMSTTNLSLMATAVTNSTGGFSFTNSSYSFITLGSKWDVWVRFTNSTIPYVGRSWTINVSVTD